MTEVEMDRTLRLAIFLMLPAPWIAGCGGQAHAPEEDAGAEDAGVVPADTDGGGPPTCSSVSVTATIAPAEERTLCADRPLGGERSRFVSELRSRLTVGGHHAILYRSSGTDLQEEPFDCDPFFNLAGDEHVPLMATQVPDEELALPAGTALRLEPEDHLRLETHFINTSDRPIDVVAEFTLCEIDEANVRAEVGFLGMGTPDIDLPAGAEMTVGPRFVAFDEDLEGIKVFGMSGHTHQLGTDVRVRMASNAREPGVEIYPPRAFDWDEPPVARFDPPIEIGPDTGFSIECSWRNTTDRRVRFGESAEDEMCFLWAYYYPSQGPRLCIQTEALGFPVSVCCPGDPLCALVDDATGSGVEGHE